MITKVSSITITIIINNNTTMSNFEENSEDDAFETFHISHIHLHTLVENAKAFIPISLNFYNQTLLAIGLATDYINKSTEDAAIKVARTESPTSLLSTLGETSTSLLENVNDGLDCHRVKLSEAVTRLAEAVEKHGAKDNTKVDNVKDDGATKNLYKSTMTHIHAALDLTRDKLRSEAATAAEEIEELAEDWAGDVPEVLDELLSDARQLIGDEAAEVQRALASAVETVEAVVSAALDSAAPYVHSAEVAAGEFNTALTSDLLIGSYVTLAEQTAAVLLEGAQTYHLSQEEVETNYSSI
jgi:hypothetical protein